MAAATSAPASSDAPPLLDVRNLSIRFNSWRGVVDAVQNVSFTVGEGETLAILGESGSGKSVTSLALTRLLPTPPAEYAGGSILVRGRDVLTMPDAELRRLRGGVVSYVFQEPGTSLNPVFTIRSQIAEAIRLHRPDVPKAGVDAEIIRWLDLVGIVDPAKRLRDYPHQLSGGMQQRVMIAMALSAHPKLLVADEPTTALDVTIQAQIIELLRELKRKLNMAIILITHNFGIVGGLADRVAVMYRGRIVEHGRTERVLREPRHPYTKALIECIPRIGQRRQRLHAIDHEALALAAREYEASAGPPTA